MATRLLLDSKTGRDEWASGLLSRLNEAWVTGTIDTDALSVGISVVARLHRAGAYEATATLRDIVADTVPYASAEIAGVLYRAPAASPYLPRITVALMRLAEIGIRADMAEYPKGKKVEGVHFSQNPFMDYTKGITPDTQILIEFRP